MEHKQLVCTARRRAGMKFGFFVHLAVFIVVNTLLFVVNQTAAPGYAWFPFPLGGWALGLTIHGLAVYFSLSGLRERLVESELRKLESRGGQNAR